MDLDEIVQRKLSGVATDEEHEDLERQLSEDPALRKRWVWESALDSGLRRTHLRGAEIPGQADDSGGSRSPKGTLVWGTLSGLAVCSLVVAAFLWSLPDVAEGSEPPLLQVWIVIEAWVGWPKAKGVVEESLPLTPPRGG